MIRSAWVLVGAVFGIAFVATCGGLVAGPGAAHADGNQGGTRIKIKRVVGTDGSNSFAGFYDADLKVDCVFTRATDGTTRCLPFSSPSSVPTGSQYFSDAACTMALV